VTNFRNRNIYYILAVVFLMGIFYLSCFLRLSTWEDLLIEIFFDAPLGNFRNGMKSLIFLGYSLLTRNILDF
jgi:hypothetical protein